MKDIIIFGATQLAEQIIDAIHEDGQYRIKAVSVEARYIDTDNSLFKGFQVYPFEDIETHFSVKDCEFIVCVGYNEMNNTRKRIYAAIMNKGYGIAGYVHPSATVLSQNIGMGNLVFEKAVVGRNVSMGAGNILYPCSLISHHTTVGDFNFFAISSSVAGNVTVGNNCFIGNNSSTKNGISLSDYTLVGAGCYISNSTNPYDVYVPARSIRLDGKKSTDFIL